MSETEGPRRETPVVKWKAGVKEYMQERGTSREGRIGQTKRECVDRELFCRGFRESRLIDRQIL